MKDAAFTLGDGRALAYTDIGEPDWPCMVFFHGAPSSRLRPAYLEEEFVKHQIRVVSPDRPGYGGSTPQPGRRFNDWIDDVRALASGLELEGFMVSGHSSGGPYALACAAGLPDQVAACITLGGVTDFGWPEAWSDYFDPEAQVMRAPSEAAALAKAQELFGADGGGFMNAAAFTLPRPDEELYEDEARATLLTAARAEAFRQGVAGYAQDCFIQGRAWSFEPGSIKAPTLILHGELDALLPRAHSTHNADVVAGAEMKIVPGHGHFSILGELPALAAALSGRA